MVTRVVSFFLSIRKKSVFWIVIIHTLELQAPIEMNWNRLCPPVRLPIDVCIIGKLLPRPTKDILCFYVSQYIYMCVCVCAVSAMSGYGTTSLLDELLNVLPEKTNRGKKMHVTSTIMSMYVSVPLPRLVSSSCSSCFAFLSHFFLSVYVCIRAMLRRRRDGQGTKRFPDRPLRLALVGRPNAGKSSILNVLLGEQRQVVSPVPGTTRDAVDVNFKVWNEREREREREKKKK